MTVATTKSSGVVRWVFRGLLNTLYHQVLAIVSVYVVWLASTHYSRVTLHIILSTIGYVPIMAEAIILFATDNLWTERISRKTKCTIHGILLLMGTAVLTAGIALEINSRNRHFRSYHGLTGLISLVLTLVSLFLGLFSLYSQELKRFARPVLFKFIHTLIGMAAFGIGISSLILGFYERSFKSISSEESRLAASVATALVSLYAIYASIKSCFNQFKGVLNIG